MFVGGEAGYIQPQHGATVQVQQARVTKNGPRKRHAGPEDGRANPSEKFEFLQAVLQCALHDASSP